MKSEAEIEAAKDAGLLYGRNAFYSAKPCGGFGTANEAMEDWRGRCYPKEIEIPAEMADAFEEQYALGVRQAISAEVRK